MENTGSQAKVKHRSNPRTRMRTRVLQSFQVQQVSNLARHPMQYNRPISYLVRSPRERAIMVELHYADLTSEVRHYVKTLGKMAAAQARELGWKTIRVYEVNNGFGPVYHFSNLALPKEMDPSDCPVLAEHLKVSVQDVVLMLLDEKRAKEHYATHPYDYINLWANPNRDKYLIKEPFIEKFYEPFPIVEKRIDDRTKQFFKNLKDEPFTPPPGWVDPIAGLKLDRRAHVRWPSTDINNAPSDREVDRRLINDLLNVPAPEGMDPVAFDLPHVMQRISPGAIKGLYQRRVGDSKVSRQSIQITSLGELNKETGMVNGTGVIVDVKLTEQVDVQQAAKAKALLNDAVVTAPDPSINMQSLGRISSDDLAKDEEKPE